MITIEEALRIALDCHEGLKDLDGKPAILHPLAVGMAGNNRQEIIGGFLHDVVEDSDLTVDDLLRKGVDEGIVDALRLLTHEKGSDYSTYIQRIIDSGNRLAQTIKLNTISGGVEPVAT